MKVSLFIVFVGMTMISFSQSKKKRIEILSQRVDSLTLALKFQQESSLEKSNLISKMILSVKDLEAQIILLNDSIKSSISKLDYYQSALEIKTDSIIFLIAELEKSKLTNNTDSTSDKPECSKFNFWEFIIGLTDYKTIEELFKTKKKQGVFEELFKGRIVFGFLPESDVIEGKGKTKLNNILTYACSGISCHFYDDILAGIEINYTWKEDYPKDLFERQVADMERLFGIKAVTSIELDINDDKSKIAILKKEGIVVNIKDDLKPENAFAPSIRIYCEK